MLKESIKTHVVGVDVAENETSYAVVDVRGNMISKESFPTKDFPNVNDFIAHLSEGIIMLAEQTCGYENVRSVGLCARCANSLTGCIEKAPNSFWKGTIPIAAMMRDRLGLAVAIANVGHIRGLGEYSFGCAHGMSNFIIITIGLGLGSSLFSNGQVHIGANGFAGEIGHACVIPDGRQCACGHKGCLEAYCASYGILETARELMEESAAPSLMRGRSDLTPELIAQFCDEGDELAIETYRKTGHILGFGLANYASIINPEGIIITGGVSRAGKWLLEPTNETFEEHVFHNIQGRVKILTSTLTDVERDLLGASALAWKVKEYSLFK